MRRCSCGDGDEVRAGPGSRGLLDRSGAMRKHPHHPPARGRTAKPDKGCLPSLLIRRASRSVPGRLTLAKPAPNRHPGQPGRSAPPPQPSGSEPVRRRSRASHQSSPERSERGGGLAERGRRGRRGAFRIELIARRSIVQRPRYPTTMLRMVPLPASGEDGEEKNATGARAFPPMPPHGFRTMRSRRRSSRVASAARRTDRWARTARGTRAAAPGRAAGLRGAGTSGCGPGRRRRFPSPAARG